MSCCTPVQCCIDYSGSTGSINVKYIELEIEISLPLMGQQLIVGSNNIHGCLDKGKKFWVITHVRDNCLASEFPDPLFEKKEVGLFNREFRIPRLIIANYQAVTAWRSSNFIRDSLFDDHSSKSASMSGHCSVLNIISNRSLFGKQPKCSFCLNCSPQ